MTNVEQIFVVKTENIKINLMKKKKTTLVVHSIKLR